MPWIELISYFFGGVFLTNSVPHFTRGVSGFAFPTPFSKPPGKGLSSPTTNVVWGLINLLVGYLLISQVGQFDIKNLVHAGVLGVAIFAFSLLLARQFGAVAAK